MDQQVEVPVFHRASEGWHAGAHAMGPFGGLHGGAVSGLLVGEVEQAGLAQDLGQIMSATVYLVRPAPLEGLTTRVTPVRTGNRLAVFENELMSNGKLFAKASVCFLKAAPLDGPALPREIMFDTLEGLPAWEFDKTHFNRSYLDAVDVRFDGQDMFWVKARQPLLSDPSPVASALSFADFSTLFAAAGLGPRPKAGGWPNADLSLHLARAPQGPWIGVKPRFDWYDSGCGFAESEIYDASGRIGRSCQSVALSPLG